VVPSSVATAIYWSSVLLAKGGGLGQPRPSAGAHSNFHPSRVLF
jgi:hypothetical protein